MLPVQRHLRGAVPGARAASVRRVCPFDVVHASRLTPPLPSEWRPAQSDVIFASEAPDARVVASRLRMQLQPLRDEKAFINSYFYLRKCVPLPSFLCCLLALTLALALALALSRYTKELAASVPERYPGQRAEAGTSDLVFPYSLYFVYYEQYTYVQVRRGVIDWMGGQAGRLSEWVISIHSPFFPFLTRRACLPACAYFFLLALALPPRNATGRGLDERAGGAGRRLCLHGAAHGRELGHRRLGGVERARGGAGRGGRPGPLEPRGA